MLFFVLVIFLQVLSPTWAVTVAVIDTGFDLDHEVLKPRLLLGETDEEGMLLQNGFADWKFQDNSHLKTALVEGTPLQEVLLYRSLKAKSHQQGLTQDERNWMERKSSDAGFKEKLKAFKKQAHGTLVSGILLKDSDIQLFPIKGLGIDVPTVVVETSPETLKVVAKGSEQEFLQQVKLSEERVIRKMAKILEWISLHNITVVNASYGVTEKHITRRFSEWHKDITGLELDSIKLKSIVDAYFESLYARGTELLSKYPHMLFIFSAGNLGLDNAAHHHFPSRIRLPNVITVAALNGDYLASFSNWGIPYVDVAAPGVGVLSLIPSVYSSAGTYTAASGTSMAAPYVSNLAARSLIQNPNLKAFEIKKILVETSTPLATLKDKLVAGGGIDPERALKAAQFSKEMDIDKAIQLATSDVIVVPQKIDIQEKLMGAIPKITEDTDEPEPTPSSESSSHPTPATASPDNSAPPPSVIQNAPPAPTSPSASGP